jgi:hypothetical protein
MPLNERQQHELGLTAAQSLFAVVLISRFAMNWKEAPNLLLPFAAQLLMPATIIGFDVRMSFTIGYIVAAQCSSCWTRSDERPSGSGPCSSEKACRPRRASRQSPRQPALASESANSG